MARELEAITLQPGADDFGQAIMFPDWRRLARHVQKLVRAARGRTEGYVAIVHQFGGHPAILLSRDGTTLANARSQAAAEEGDVARLVFVPRRGRGKRK